MKKLGIIIRERRKEKGLKGFELAKEIGVHQTYITYIEKHGKLPSLPVLKKLEKALDIDLHQAYIKEKIDPDLLARTTPREPVGSPFKPINGEDTYKREISWDLYEMLVSDPDKDQKAAMKAFLNKWKSKRPNDKDLMQYIMKTISSLQKNFSKLQIALPESAEPVQKK